MKFLVFVVLIVAGPLFASAAFAQNEGHVSRVTQEASMEIYSPFCPGKTLAMCPSPNAAEVRMDIQNMAKTGMTVEQIKEKVVLQYGEEFRVVDPPMLDNVGLMGLLFCGMLGAGGLIWMYSRRRKGDAPENTEAAPKADDDYVSELRDEYRS